MKVWGPHYDSGQFMSGIGNLKVFSVILFLGTSVCFGQEAPVIRVLSYNVGGIPLIMPLPKRRSRFDEIARRLKDSHYDFVFLQEVWTLSDARYIHRKSGYPYAARFNKGILFGNGLMILSRHPISDIEFFPFTAREPSKYFLDDEFWAKKGILAARVNMAGREFDIYDTHLISTAEHDHYIALRNTQLFDIHSAIKEYSGERPFVLAGDFNFPPRQQSYDILRLLLLTRDVCPQNRPGACPATDVDGRVDQIHLSRHFNQEKQVEQGVDFRWERPYPFFRLSDHQGVTASIGLGQLPLNESVLALAPDRRVEIASRIKENGPPDWPQWWALTQIKSSLWQNLEVVSQRAALSIHKVSAWDFFYLAYFGRRYHSFWNMDRQIVLALTRTANENFPSKNQNRPGLATTLGFDQINR